MNVNENACTSDGRDGPFGSNGIKGPNGRYGLYGFMVLRAKMVQMSV